MTFLRVFIVLFSAVVLTVGYHKNWNCIYIEMMSTIVIFTITDDFAYKSGIESLEYSDLIGWMTDKKDRTVQYNTAKYSTVR